MSEDANAPDWPPMMSATRLRNGLRRHGSTGQLFEVQNKQWVRISPAPKPASEVGDGFSDKR
jgi:hypothetical protein